MKQYTQEEIAKFREDLVDSLTPEQIVLYEVLADAVIANLLEIRKTTNQAEKESMAVIDALRSKLKETEGELAEIKRTLALYGINL